MRRVWATSRPYLRVQTLAEQAGISLASHFAMELHVHLAATHTREPWAEHFEWLEPLFNERLEIRDGRMPVPNRPGLGLSDRVAVWTVQQAEVGQRA